MKLILNFAILFTATAVSAASAGGDHGIPWSTMIIPQMVNFTIFATVLSFLLAKPIKNAFANRGQEFEAAVKRAEEVRLSAERAHKEVKDRLQKLETSSKSSVDEANKEAAVLREQIIADAHVASEKMANEAVRSTHHEFEKALLTLRTELVTNSVKIAEDEVRGKADASMQAGLQSEFLKKVEGVRL
jgi:F-type H+-transporting ATPase subunit b